MSKENVTCTLVVPIRNEAANLAALVSQIPHFFDEIILVVDESSSDNSYQVACSIPRVSRVIVQQTKGKGAALSEGFAASSHELIFTIDSDGSMNPAHLELLAGALLGGECQVVKGSRNIDGAGSDDITKFRDMGNNFLTLMSNKLFGGQNTDATYGLWGFTRTALDLLEIKYLHTKKVGPFTHRSMSYGHGFEIELLMLCRAKRRGMKVCEIGTSERARWTGGSNLRAITDGMRSLFAILVERCRAYRNFK